MPYRLALLLPVLAALLSAESGTTPKAKPADYSAHAQLADLSIGAEFTVHSFSGERTMFLAADYLVVEVALYPAKGERLAVAPDQFSLQVNGKRQVLAQSPEFVVPSLESADWQKQGPQPGDEERMSPSQALARTALPAAEIAGPVSGFLYFPYRGRTKSIRSLDLHYDGPAGAAKLPLREARVNRTPGKERFVPLRPGLS
jgi:hypothetical protein